MSIKFVCSCGKHLRARDSMAGRRIRCPRCGCPAGVPSLQPTHRGTAANPMTPEERRREARLRPAAPVAEDAVLPATAADAALPPGATLPNPEPVERVSLRRPPPRPREARWYHCLAYPCLAWPVVLVLGLAWAGWVVGLAALPPALHAMTAPPGPWLLGVPSLVVTLGLGGYTAAFLDCALVCAAAGEVGRVRWPGGDLLLVVKSLGRWLLVLLTGPVPLAAVGFSYWLHAGDLGLLDYVILAELGVLGVTYAVLGVAAAGERQRVRDANPCAAARLAYRLGARALVVPVAAALAVIHGWLAVTALTDVHDRGAAVLMLPLSGVSGMFLATFLFRLMGMWCYRSRPAPVEG
jgi:hypothetical protein